MPTRIPAERHDHPVADPLERLAVRTAQIGREDRKSRLAHALGEGRGAEIEFVVARNEDIRRRDVQEFDDMRAAVEPRHQRGGQGVAGMGVEHRHAARPLGLHHSVEAGETATALDLGHQVDVVDEEEREGRFDRPGTGGRGQAYRETGPETEAQGLTTGRTWHRDRSPRGRAVEFPPEIQCGRYR